LTGGNEHDITQGPALVDKVAVEANVTIGSITADKGYDSAAMVAHIEAIGANPVIPQLSNRKTPRPVDWEQYKNRNIVERFFARLKQFRRVATRYDKLMARFTSFVQLAAVCIWLA
jgi:transposase